MALKRCEGKGRGLVGDGGGGEEGYQSQLWTLNVSCQLLYKLRSEMRYVPPSVQIPHGLTTIERRHQTDYEEMNAFRRNIKTFLFFHSTFKRYFSF